jgi:AcrR family transcriptional regulator
MTKRTAKGHATRERMLDAAFETLRGEGFSATTTRAVARRGGFNQALVFYHFGGLEPLLLAALDRSAAARIAAYRAAFAGEHSLPELTATMRRLYDEDVESGHVAVVAQLVAASMGNPGLRGQVLTRMQPWRELAAETLGGLAVRLGLTAVPVHDLASVVVSLYFGLNLLQGLEPEDRPADALFALAEQLVATFFPAQEG